MPTESAVVTSNKLTFVQGRTSTAVAEDSVVFPILDFEIIRDFVVTGTSSAILRYCFSTMNQCYDLLGDPDIMKLFIFALFSSCYAFEIVADLSR